VKSKTRTEVTDHKSNDQTAVIRDFNISNVKKQMTSSNFILKKEIPNIKVSDETLSINSGDMNEDYKSITLKL